MPREAGHARWIGRNAVDDCRFDQLTRIIASPASRRRVLRAAAGALASFLPVWGSLAAAACKSANAPCASDGQCCSGTCRRSGRCTRRRKLTGKCRCACVEPQIACNGECVDLATNQNHCGRCGRACANAETCEQGECRCALPWKLCDGFCQDTSMSLVHCGECGRQCPGGYTCQD